MSSPAVADNSSPVYDEIIESIIGYVYNYEIKSEFAWERAKTALIDSLGVAVESVKISPECAKLLGPTFTLGLDIPGSFQLPGTTHRVDLLKGAFDMGTMIRYLDHNDAFPGAEWGHPSDNLGGIIAAADIYSQLSLLKNDESSMITMGQVLESLIKAYEIQGCIQMANAFNKVGLDHVILVKVASTAVLSKLLQLSRQQAMSAVSHAWIDGHPLRIYRQAPNTIARKGWAAGDACMRAVHLTLLAKADQPGVPTALTCPRWGFYDTLFQGKPFQLPKKFGTWVVESSLFKINTAEGHGMTAIEAALEISNILGVKGLDPYGDIAHIDVRTQAPAMIIINKTGKLHNPADRDHCLRYMVGVVLLKGKQIETADYQNNSPWASNAKVEHLRQRITMAEDEDFTKDYHDLEVRSVANGITVTLNDGTQLPEVVVLYPKGHVCCPDTIDLVYKKAVRNLKLGLSESTVQDILECLRSEGFSKLPACQFFGKFHI